MFWGWQSGHWWLAAAVAALLEAPRMVHLRFAFSLIDLNRLANFCTVAFIGAAAYMVFSDGVAQAVIGTLQWTPVVVLPLFLAMAWSGMKTLDLSVISASLRRRAKTDSTAAHQADLGYPYVFLWVLAASAFNRQGSGFYPGLLVLGAWVLWRIRPAGRSPLVWGAVLLVAAIGGGLINTGLYRLQEAIEQIAVDWISGEGDEDPARTSTSLGHIGQLKLSDSIALRVTAPQALKLPILLRTASYNAFLSPSWLVVGKRGFLPLPQGREGIEWTLGEAGHAASATGNPMMEISATSSHLTSLLALPDNATSVASASLNDLARNPVGSVQAETRPGYYSYQVRFNGASVDRAAPGPEDLILPRDDSKLLLDLARHLQLDGKSDQEKLKLVSAYFADNFSYSTFRSGNAANRTAVSDFLTRNRSGHCEHFATATTLLLRAAGIPARYAVGFSVTEPNRFGIGYVARHRHAHAWVRAYVDGAWRDFDTTPASWTAVEEGAAPFWEPLMDVWSWLLFHARNKNMFDGETFAYGAGLLGLVWLARKLIRRKGGIRLIAQRKDKSRTKALRLAAESESELYRIEQLLGERGLSRPVHEPLTAWLARIAPQISDEAAGSLQQIVSLHYRWRFGAHPLAVEERERLRVAGQDWIARFGVARA